MVHYVVSFGLFRFGRLSCLCVSFQACIILLSVIQLDHSSRVCAYAHVICHTKFVRMDGAGHEVDCTVFVRLGFVADTAVAWL